MSLSDSKSSGTRPAPLGLTSNAVRATIVGLAARLDTISLFELLGVSESASPGDINNAFLRAARSYHPDRLVGTELADLVPLAERILARMSEASMILSDPTRRAEYVAARSGQKPPEDKNIPAVLDAEATFRKAENHLKRGDHAKAIELFEQAAKTNPNEPQYRAYLAWARFEDPKARKEALARETQRTLEDVLNKQPRFALGHYWLGEVWKFLNEPQHAQRAFGEAVNQDPNLIEASRELRLLEMRKGKPGPKPAGTASSRGGLFGRLFKK